MSSAVAAVPKGQSYPRMQGALTKRARAHRRRSRQGHAIPVLDEDLSPGNPYGPSSPLDYIFRRVRQAWGASVDETD